MWIMIAGPFQSGSKDPKIWNDNLKKLNKYAYKIFQKGHIPVIGVNMALPIIENNGWDKYNELMMPISLAMAERCDAIFRTEGVSEGADKEVAVFEYKGLPVYFNLEDVPNAKDVAW